MSEQHREKRPEHLDIDAVSAFVDRDLTTDDLATIAIHLTECSACHREVIEIRTTVVLLAALPQYAPRRSFVLGMEHARARDRGARRGRTAAEHPWTSAGVPGGWQSPPAAGAGHVAGAPRLAGWLPGLHVAAVVVGALLLLITAGDLLTLSSPPRAQFAAPAALNEPEAYPEQTQARALPVTVTAEPAMAAPAAPAESISPFERPRDAAVPAPADEASDSFALPDSDAEFAADGTAADENASQGLLAEEAPPAPQVMATAAVASVTQAVPTPMAAPGPTSADESAFGAGQPSRLRMLQIGLAIALLWLVVSIVGLRRVRA